MEHPSRQRGGCGHHHQQAGRGSGAAMLGARLRPPRTRGETLGAGHRHPRGTRGGARAVRAGVFVRHGIRDPSDTRRVLASDTEGKESLTRYETVGTSRSQEWALVRCEPATGRMHQLRIHLAARGWPIAGDAVYGHNAGTAAGEAPEPPTCARQALHAWRVSFAHPVTRVPLTIVAPLPGDMQALLSRCGIDTPAPWNAPTSRNCSSRPPRPAW